VQVHPNDEMARELLGTENGKSEAWIILEAEPGSRIYAGFKPHVTRADVEQALQQGTVVDCLHALSPRPGDCLFIPAGQVHAIEGGVLLAEVQQTSDATFRLFDWNRVGLEGKPRELHHAESLRCINWPAGPVFPAERVTLSDLPHSVRGDRLVSSPYFEIERFSLDGPWDFQCHSEFSMWMMTGGTATLKSLNGPYSRRFQAGETVLIPASPEAFQWSPAPTATVLGIRAVADCAEEHGSIAFQSHRSQGDARTRSAFSIPRVAAARRAA
jgi:mannose-6-phosphate isomerase